MPASSHVCYLDHESDDVTHGVGTVYFLRKFSHKQWELQFRRLLWGPWDDFVSGSGIYGKEIFFAVLVVSFISEFDHFHKLVERIVKQMIPSKP